MDHIGQSEWPMALRNMHACLATLLCSPALRLHPLSVYSPALGSTMAPFLRIAFNSYELGSLQAEDEASQPFCAVKMKEALSTGRVGQYPKRE